MTIWKARELYSRHPGIIDVACWEIGRERCHPKNPDCENCPMSRCCPMREAMVQRFGGGVRTPFHSLFIFKSFGGVGGAICCLRDTPDLFIGISPAHDEWQILAASPSLSNARCGRTNSRRVATPYG